MAGLAPSSTLERLAGERAGLVFWLARQFRGQLSWEDAEDVVADTLLRLAADSRLPVEPGARGAYVRRALWRDALDELRHRRGREPSARRSEPLPLDAAAELADPAASADAGLAAAQEREQQRAAVARTLARLPRRDAEVLRLRFLDELAPDAVADELGVSRDQYRRRLLSASRRALDALVDAHSGPACPQVRRLIGEDPEALLAPADAGRRDAHLSECVHCRAFALRARGALELLPLPAVGMVERLSARLGGLLGRGGESLTALRDGHEAALAGGAAGTVGAGGALTAGIGAKVVIGCAGAAVAALCAGPLSGEITRHRDAPAAARTSAQHAHARDNARGREQSPARATITAAAVPTATATARPKPTPVVIRPVTARERRRRAREASAREFGPEAATPRVTGVTATAASNGASTGAPPAPPPPRASPSAPRGSSFGGEFAP